MTDVSNVIVISAGTAPVQLYLYLYRSLFDGVELCRHCPGVVDQALVHGTFLYPTNHFFKSNQPGTWCGRQRGGPH